MKRCVTSLFFIFLPLYFVSCESDDIVVPTPCFDAGELPYRQAALELYTDFITYTTISILGNGFFSGDSISIMSNNVMVSVQIWGYICKNYSATINVKYINSSDNSRIKIETYQSVDHILGRIYWCPNVNGQCSFIEIGSLNGLIGGNHGGAFTTPLFYGSYRVYFN